MADGEANAVTKCLAALVVRNDGKHPARQKHQAGNDLQSRTRLGDFHEDSAAKAQNDHGDRHDSLPGVSVLYPRVVERNDRLPARLPELSKHFPAADNGQNAHNQADNRPHSTDGQNTAHQHSADLIHIKILHFCTSLFPGNHGINQRFPCF